MPTKKRTLSVRMDKDMTRRLEHAARLRNQSLGAFLQHAGDEAARRLLLEWAVSRHREGPASASELADETGLAVEEIMRALGTTDRQAALDIFVASCRTVAITMDKPEFLRVGEEAAKDVAAEDDSPTGSQGSRP